MKKLIALVFCIFLLSYGTVRADISAVNGQSKTFTLGSTDKAKPYKVELSLTSKGAAINTAAFRDYDNRNRTEPKPFVFLSPVDNTFSLASKRLLLPEIGKSFPLDRLNWVSEGVQKTNAGESITFSALILQDDLEYVKLTKTYTLKTEKDKQDGNAYLIDCDVTVSNLSKEEVKVALEMLGPAGVTREDPRVDMRTVTAGFVMPNGLVESTKTNLKDITKAGGQEKMFSKNVENKYIWSAVSDKYFTSIIRPVPADGNTYPKWIAENYAISIDPDIAIKDNENLGVKLVTQTASIATGKEITYKYQVYVGPKDKDIFKANALFNQLGFIRTIDFSACCGIGFGWLSFAILQAMDWVYNYIPNYGVIIIIFVLLVRLILHPVTKKSQVSMMRMAKLGPMAEEIKKKYGDNKAEMQKHMAALYREQGIAPMLGCLPMFLQMPIWVALYSAINNGIEFRGAAFLPFWITDLSLPDSLFTMPGVIEQVPVIGPMIGTGFNVLPILLGIAMFAQQKLMPSTAAPSTNPQAAQQQKMMLWMMPIMMLVFLYRAPSGLNLYIMASTAAGVLEQYVIRKHIKERESLEAQGLVPTTSKLGGKLKKKKPKPPIKFS